MRISSARVWALAILSGILQVLPFPFAGPVPLWRTAFCWVALAPLLWTLLGAGRENDAGDTLRSAFVGYLCGFCFYLGNCYWIFQTMHLYGGLPEPVAAGILILFCLYLGLYHALFAALFAAARIRLGPRMALILAPFLWVAVELARARITGFPWDLLGVAEIENPLLTRLAPLGGAYAVSFVIVLVNVLWILRIKVRDRRYLRPMLVAAAIFFFSIYVAALRRLPRKTVLPTASATLLQENLSVGTEARGADETIQEKLDSFSALSRNPAHLVLNGIPGLESTTVVRSATPSYVGGRSGEGYQPADVIVWPESPSDFHTNDPTFEAAATNLAMTMNAPLILGSLGVVPDPSIERGGHLYDSAALIAADGQQVGRYDKIHLVPFGEYVPFKQVLFFADRLTAGVGNMDRGSQRSVFQTRTPNGVHRFGVFICYESIFGDEVRQFVRSGAEVLVNLSDDGWYGDSGAAWQHLNMVRMRAIENHRWVLRATNTGITASIDPYGRVVAALPRRIRSAATVPYGYEEDLTFYTRHGDWFAYTCVMVTLGMLGVAFRHRVN